MHVALLEGLHGHVIIQLGYDMCGGCYPLSLVGQGRLLRVLAGLHQIRLQLRRSLLGVRQKLARRISIPQLQDASQCQCQS